MAHDHVTTLMELQATSEQLDIAQDLIDASVAFARKTAPDEAFYQMLYAKQLEVDKKREYIEQMMIFIPMCN
jgi:hypothetical protein